MYENYLAHYGVKGMKWGQRRYGVGRRVNKLAKKRERVYKTMAQGYKDEAAGRPLRKSYFKYQTAVEKYNA